MEDNAGKAKAKAMLYAYGGDKIRANLELLATYSTATYAETVTHLITTFTQETKKLDALMFIGSKPGAF